jgi:hypothetical protein
MGDFDFGRRGSQTRWYDGSSRYLALFVAAITLLTTTIVFLTAGQELGGVGELVTAGIGLVGLGVSLQLETLFRIAERAQAREQYARLLETTEDYPALLTIAASALGASVATCKKTKVPQFRTEVVNILNHADVRLQELAQGRLRAADGDNTLTLDRFTATAALLQATTDDLDTSWWLQDSGDRFLKLNAELTKRGVRVERVWILNELPSDDTRDVLRKHHAAKVEVFIVRADHKGLDRSLLVNMTMMDGVFLHEDLPNKLGQAVEYLYSENAADLERARRRFAQLKARVKRYEDDKSLDSLFEISGAVPKPAGHTAESEADTGSTDT